MTAGIATAALGAETPSSLYTRDSRGRSAFLDACLGRHQTEIERLLHRGIVLDIHEAAASAQSARVEEILALNPGSVNHRDLQGATPMHYAAACGHVAMSNLLLGKGAALSLPAPGLANATPGHLCIDFPDPLVALQLAQTLFGNGADVNARTLDGSSPLHLAAAAGSAELTGFLLRKGASANLPDNNGKLPFDVARGPALEVLRNAAALPRDSYTSRFRGIHRDDTYGIPQQWINDFVMFSHFDFDKVRALYARCPDLLLTRSTWDEIAVEAAAHMGREDMALFFLDRGSPLALCTAVMLGRTDDVSKLLAEEPGRIHERGAHDFPLLWYTIFGKERTSLAELLLAAGVNPRSSMMGNSSLDLAKKKNYAKIAALLEQHGA